LERLQAGEPAARRELINQSAHRLREIAHLQLRRFKSMQRWIETDDVLQEASIALLKSLEAVRPATVLDYFRFAAAQMRRTLVNLWRKHYGAQGFARNHAKSKPDRTLSDHHAVDPIDPARFAELAEIHELIEQLPPQLRDMFDILWYQAITYSEAAAILGTSERHVGRMWLQAKISLREQMSGWADQSR
jgi:RNA polymerase sigma-70 factor (ECF subfamily)